MKYFTRMILGTTILATVFIAYLAWFQPPRPKSEYTKTARSPKNIILKTKRLYFRPFVEDDLEMLYKLYSDPNVTKQIKASLKLFMGKITKESTKDILQHFIKEHKKYGYSKWAAFESETGNFVGRIGLSSTENPKTADVGYILHKKHWGKGYATEITKAIVAWAFNNTKLETITATTTPEHKASIRVMEKAGMSFSKNFVLKGMEFVQYKIEKNTSKSSPQIIIRTQTAKEAFDYIMGIIEWSHYYKKYGYYVELPKHDEFKNMYENPNYPPLDRKTLKKIFTSELYDQSVFKEPLATTHNIEGIIKKGLEKLTQLQKNWGFDLKPKYEIVFSPYGAIITHQISPTIGRMTTLTNPAIICDPGVLETALLHKIVNIGIEKNIIQKYNLSRWQKERVIDLICMLYLNEVIPYYTPPEPNKKHGDRKIDPFVNKQTITQNLPAAIEKFKMSLKKQ